MTDAAPPPQTSSTPPADIPLEDIDRILEAEDPGFTKSLEEVRSVSPDDPSVTIEAEAIDEVGPDEKVDDKPVPRWTKVKVRFKQAWIRFKARLCLRVTQLGRDSLIFLKTKPKEWLLFTISMIKALVKASLVPLRAFAGASRAQKLIGLLALALGAATVTVLVANFKGIWLPSLNQPLLHSFSDVADHMETYDPKDGGESFYTAFPQERNEFLFPKMKVNLRRTRENPWPMGAFEVVILMDSKDTAIELRDREVELSDLVQRVFEEETFSDLETEMGKSRLKSRIKRELDQKLTQGWVKDVSFKTFILKP